MSLIKELWKGWAHPQDIRICFGCGRREDKIKLYPVKTDFASIGQFRDEHPDRHREMCADCINELYRALEDVMQKSPETFII